MPWTDVNRENPCPSCGSTTWCTVAPDRTFGVCRRPALSSIRGKLKRDRNGAEYLPWRSFRASTPKPRIASVFGPKACLNADVLDEIYRCLLHRLPLARGHRENLRRRGLPDEFITRNLYGSLPTGHLDRAPVVNDLVDRFGAIRCAAVPGLVANPFPTIAGRPGILIPVRDIVGRIVAVRIRADVDTGKGRYSYLSSKRQGGKGPGAQVHVPSFAGSRDVIRITEGELKADVATVLSGVLTLSVPGVGIWRPVLPVVAALNPKVVRIAYDQDVETNANVKRAFHQLAAAIHAAGYNTEVEKWS